MIRRELRPMLTLATPVVMAELGWVTMGIVDTVMVGGLGAGAIGAVGLASMLFFAVTVFAMGLLLGLDPLVSQAFGARRLDDCHRWLVDGIWLAALVTLPMVAVIFGMNATLGRWGLPREVLFMTRPYLAILTWSLPPLLFYVAFRRYLQAMNLVSAVMFPRVAANAVHAVANRLLIYAHFAPPAMRVRAAAHATLSATVFLARGLLIVILRPAAHPPPAPHRVHGRLP